MSLWSRLIGRPPPPVAAFCTRCGSPMGHQQFSRHVQFDPATGAEVRERRIEWSCTEPRYRNGKPAPESFYFDHDGWPEEWDGWRRDFVGNAYP